MYVQDVELHMDRKNRTGYRAAVRQLIHIRDLAERQGGPRIGADIIGDVRAEHRLKRTLMTLRDRASASALSSQAMEPVFAGT